ncbi:MAG: hypothetical protein HY901_37285 [Deltaproteobacteria bacterium]|nr:hypothetical protein [Deltaproteobacteria bacterium]
MLLRFIPQATLDAWMDQGKVDVQSDRIVEVATRQEFAMREAVHFIKVESGADTPGWTHKVKAVEDVRAQGAEHYMSSVILGETVFVVEPGWLAEDPDLIDAASTVRVGSKKSEGKNPEADALAQLLLDKLS